MKTLRIATMVTGHFTTPPPRGIVYAPMDIAVEVSEGLAARGHHVDFYAPEGSNVNVMNLVTLRVKALNQNGGQPILKSSNVGNAEANKIFNLWDQYILSEMFRRAARGEYDLLHIHPVDRALPLSRAFEKIPVFYTLHDPIYPWRAEIFRMFQSPNQWYVSISDAQRQPAPDLQYAGTVYNGVRTSEFPFRERAGDHLLFVGRLQPEKGVAEAVQAALLAREKLVIVGPPVTGVYWEKNVKPYLGENIQYVGHVPREKLYGYYGNAKATLVPIQWEEPFGLVMTESMACGTPVVAFPRGSVPEIVENGVNGYIVKDVGEMAAAVKKISAIDRRACRRTVEDRFSTERMVEYYEKIFLKYAA